MPIVLIWNNNAITTGHSYTGHAALSITGKFSHTEFTNHDYVSWWPGDEENGKTESATGTNFLEDLRDENGYTPDHIIIMPQMDEAKMKAKWKEIKDKVDSHYRYMYKNCSTIAARVLRAGSKKGSGWQRHSHVWTPLKVKRLAHGMGGSDISWEFFVQNYLAKSAGLSKGEIKDLYSLKKRTSRHGSWNNNTARFQNGKDTGRAPKIVIQGEAIGGKVASVASLANAGAL